MSDRDSSRFLEFIKQATDEESALIYMCILQIQNTVYAKTGFDLFHQAQNFDKKSEQTIAAIKILWLSQDHNLIFHRIAFNIWWHTMASHSNEQLENLCKIWQSLQRAKTHLEKASEEISNRYPSTLFINNEFKIPYGIC